jgi:hypothetical protein
MLSNTQTTAMNAQMLIQKIQSLPPERVAEVDDFVEFLRLRVDRSQAQAQERDLTRMASQVSEPSFASVWDNAEDEAYDAL